MTRDRTEYFREYRRAHRQKLNAVERKRYYDTARAGHLARAYGITPEQYDAMLAGQKNRCALCDVHVGERKLDVDHCHETGRIRGLLCRQCNMAIGRLGDTPESLRRVIAYLESSFPRPAALSDGAWTAVGPGPDDVCGRRGTKEGGE